MSDFSFPARPRAKAPATIAAHLRFDAISHSYDNKKVLHEISFEVMAGETVCLLGASGCGKSTLLRITAGLERQSDGRLWVNNQEISGEKVFVPPEKRNIGLVFQDSALFPHLTILQNVMFGLSRLKKHEAGREARLALRRVEMEHAVHDFPHMLSGGQQQRVALARAIAPRPAVLLMDEPFSGLDGRLRETVREEALSVLRECRATAIIVTHDAEEAMRIADKIVLLREGRVVQVGAPETLYNAPVDLETACFFSQMNVFDGVVNHGTITTAFGQIDSSLPHDTHVNIAVRPHHLKIETERSLAHSGNGSVLQGRVLHNYFLGEVAMLEVGIGQLEKPLIVRSPFVKNLPQQTVSISCEPTHMLVFKK